MGVVKATFIALFLLSLGESPVLAQSPIDQLLPNLSGQQGVVPENADISVTGQVRARELIFHSQPQTNIRVWVTPGRNAGWTVDRQNVPQTVQPGVTYTDIGIQLQIYSVFEEIP